MGFTPDIQQLVGEHAPEWFKLYRDSDEALWSETDEKRKNAIRKLLKVDFGCEGCGKV